jgi:hypothetical protein
LRTHLPCRSYTSMWIFRICILALGCSLTVVFFYVCILKIGSTCICGLPSCASQLTRVSVTNEVSCHCMQAHIIEIKFFSSFFRFISPFALYAEQTETKNIDFRIDQQSVQLGPNLAGDSFAAFSA